MSDPAGIIDPAATEEARTMPEEKEEVPESRREQWGQVEEWLDGLGLSKYKAIFEGNDITDMDTVKCLARADLSQIGITSVGHQVKLMGAVEKLRYNQADEENERHRRVRNEIDLESEQIDLDERRLLLKERQMDLDERQMNLDERRAELQAKKGQVELEIEETEDDKEKRSGALACLLILWCIICVVLGLVVAWLVHVQSTRIIAGVGMGLAFYTISVGIFEMCGFFDGFFEMSVRDLIWPILTSCCACLTNLFWSVAQSCSILVENDATIFCYFTSVRR